MVLDMLLAKNIPGIYNCKSPLWSTEEHSSEAFSLCLYLPSRLQKYEVLSLYLLLWHVFKHNINIKHFLCTFSSNCMNRSNTEQGTKSGLRGLNSSFKFWLYFLGSVWSQLNHLKYLWASTSFIKGGQIDHASLTGCVKVSKRYGN